MALTRFQTKAYSADGRGVILVFCKLHVAYLHFFKFQGKNLCEALLHLTGQHTAAFLVSALFFQDSICNFVS